MIEHILALDLATSVGWAHTNGTSGVQVFKPRRGDSPGMRYLEFRAWLLRVFDLVPIDLLVYEQAGHHRSNAATHVAHGLIATAESVAAERRVEITSRSPSDWKKQVLPDISFKKANKQRIIMEVENHWPNVVIQSDDQSDAIMLLWSVLVDLKVGGTRWHQTRIP